MSRLPDPDYDPADTEKQLDHAALHPFLQTVHYYADGTEDTARNLSATVSAQNAVIKDLIARVDMLEAFAESRGGDL